MILRLACICTCLSAASAAGSIFNLDDELLNHPWHLFGMFVLVIGMSVGHEVFFEWLNSQVKSSSGKKLKEHLEHEVMNLGLIGLWLTFVDALGITHEIWSTTLFHYTHFVLFVMMIILMGLTGTLLFTMKVVWKTWVRYERFWRQIEYDTNIPQRQKEVTLSIYWHRNQNAQRMISCLEFFQKNIPNRYNDVEFTRYLKKSQRRWLLRLLHLNKYSWVSLVVVISLIALFLHINKDNIDSALDVFIFVFTVGWGSLFSILLIMGKTIRSFRRFCLAISKYQELADLKKKRKFDPENPPASPMASFDMSKYFWRGDPNFHIQILQIILLYQVFYMAVIIVNVVPKAYVIPMGWVLVISSMVPTIAIFGFLLPTMMPPFTCLASLGTFLDLELLEEMAFGSEREVVPRKLANLDLSIKALPYSSVYGSFYQSPGAGSASSNVQVNDRGLASPLLPASV